MKIFKSVSVVAILILIIMNILYAIALNHDFLNYFSSVKKVSSGYQMTPRADSSSVTTFNQSKSYD